MQKTFCDDCGKEECFPGEFNHIEISIDWKSAAIGNLKWQRWYLSLCPICLFRFREKTNEIFMVNPCHQVTLTVEIYPPEDLADKKSS